MGVAGRAFPLGVLRVGPCGIERVLPFRGGDVPPVAVHPAGSFEFVPPRRGEVVRGRRVQGLRMGLHRRDRRQIRLCLSLFYIFLFLFLWSAFCPVYTRTFFGRFAGLLFPQCILSPRLRRRTVMLLKTRKYQASVPAREPTNAAKFSGKPRSLNETIEKFSIDRHVYAVCQMLVCPSPNFVKSTNNAEPVRFQTGRNPDNSRICIEVCPHLDPVACHVGSDPSFRATSEHRCTQLRTRARSCLAS